MYTVTDQISLKIENSKCAEVVDGTDITIQELRPLMLAHAY